MIIYMSIRTNDTYEFYSQQKKQVLPHQLAKENRRCKRRRCRSHSSGKVGHSRKKKHHHEEEKTKEGRCIKKGGG